jgi:hypothetical protein
MVPKDSGILFLSLILSAIHTIPKILMTVTDASQPQNEKFGIVEVEELIARTNT